MKACGNSIKWKFRCELEIEQDAFDSVRLIFVQLVKYIKAISLKSSKRSVVGEFKVSNNGVTYICM